MINERRGGRRKKGSRKEKDVEERNGFKKEKHLRKTFNTDVSESRGVSERHLLGDRKKDNEITG